MNQKKLVEKGLKTSGGGVVVAATATGGGGMNQDMIKIQNAECNNKQGSLNLGSANKDFKLNLNIMKSA